MGVAASAGPASLWAGPKPQGPLKPFVIDMQGNPVGRTGADGPPTIFHDTMERVRWHGHEALRRVAATTDPGGTEFTRWADLIFDEKTLLPYRSEWRRADGSFVRHEFDGVHVKETRKTAGAAPEITAAFDLPEPAFAWSEGVGLPILLALPLREGVEGSAPVISGDPSSIVPCTQAPCFAARMSYRVVGQETITGISNKPTPTWKVWVPGSAFTFWIATADPRLEGVNWPRPGGMFSMGPVVKR